MEPPIFGICSVYYRLYTECQAAIPDGLTRGLWPGAARGSRHFEQILRLAMVLNPGAMSRRLRELEAENAKRKRMYADLALENTAIKDLLHRKL